MRASEHKKNSRTAARNLTARKDEHGRSLRNGAPTPILTARKDGHLFANFAGLPGRPCAGSKRQCIAQQHMHQGVILCNGVAPCGESPPVCRPITAREGFKIRTSYFVAALSASRETVRKAGRKAQRYAHIPRKRYTCSPKLIRGAIPCGCTSN